VACGSGRPLVITAASGSLTSPNYPSNYPNRANCQWRIDPPGNTPIILEFDDFKTESGYDVVAVHDGASSSATQLVRASGSTLPSPITSTGGTIFISFTSDSSVTDKGFSARFYRPDGACSGGEPRVIEVGIGETGTLTSPNHPDDYPANSECAWTLQAPSNGAVELEFDVFVIEEEDLDGCRWDYVEILDPVTQETNRHCGNDTPPARTSAGNELTINFNSDQSIQRMGFSASYKGVDRSQVTSPQPTEPPTPSRGTGTGPTFPPTVPTAPPTVNLTAPPISSYLSGTFTSEDGEALSPTCLAGYGAEMRKALVSYVFRTNDLIGSSLCTAEPELKLTDGDTSLVAIGAQALVTLRLTQDGVGSYSFAQHAACSIEMANHAADHSNWDSPIIPPLPGCSPVMFDPPQFTVDETEYDCPI